MSGLKKAKEMTVMSYRSSIENAKTWEEVKNLTDEMIDYVNQNISKFSQNDVLIMRGYFNSHPLKKDEDRGLLSIAQNNYKIDNIGF